MYERLSQERETALHRTFDKAHVDCLTLRTDEDLGEALLRFMIRRKQRVRASAVARQAA